MGKEELDFGKLGSVNKPTFKKTELPLDAEKAVQKIHSTKTEKERVKRVTIDLPFSVYTEIRKKTIDEDITLKDYFIGLAKNGLKG